MNEIQIEKRKDEIIRQMQVIKSSYEMDVITVDTYIKMANRYINELSNLNKLNNAQLASDNISFNNGILSK